MYRSSLGVVAFAALFCHQAFAADADVLEVCQAYYAKNGGDSSVCPCYAELAEDNAELREALLEIVTPEDAENAPDVVTQAADSCSS